MHRARRILLGIAITLLQACRASAPPAPAPARADGSIDERIEATRIALKSARYALEPPATRRETRDAATVPTMAADAVTPEWVMLQIAGMLEVADEAAVPNPQRADANVLAAQGEGLLIEHFTTMFWNKAEPGRRVIGYLQAALAQDPDDEEAAVAYTFALLGIRNTGFRAQAEDTMGVRTTAELIRVAPLLAGHVESLRAQSVLRAALDAAKSDGETRLEPLRGGLDARIAGLRARNADAAEDVDAELRRRLD